VREYRDHSDEHVVQKALGGNLTIKERLPSCATHPFSVIDQVLTDQSVIALTRLMRDPSH